MWFDTIQFHTSLFTFQSNCAEGLHFSAFHFLIWNTPCSKLSVVNWSNTLWTSNKGAFLCRVLLHCRPHPAIAQQNRRSQSVMDARSAVGGKRLRSMSHTPDRRAIFYPGKSEHTAPFALLSPQLLVGHRDRHS